MGNISLRIKQYSDYKGISIRQIESTIGASNGVISNAIKKNTDIQSKWLSIIITCFEDINPTWLLTGKGEMLISTEEEILTESEPIVEYKIQDNGIVDYLKNEVKELQAKYEHKLEENAVLRHEIDNLRYQLKRNADNARGASMAG